MRQGGGAVVHDTAVRVADQQASWLAFAAIGFSGLAALFLIWPLYRIFLPVEVDTNESWNAWQTVRAMGGGPGPAL